MRKYDKKITQQCFDRIIEDPFGEVFWGDGEAALGRQYKKVWEAIKNYNTFLEVGPGTGAFSFHLLLQGKQVDLLDVPPSEAVEIQDDELEVFKNFCQAYNFKPDIFITNVTKFISKKKYDVVFALGVVEYVADYQKAVNNMISWANHEVIIIVPVGRSYYNPVAKHFFTRDDFKFISNPYTIITDITKTRDLETGNRNFYLRIDCSNKQKKMEST